MRITYRTLGDLIAMMDESQKDSDVTVELPTEQESECFAAELRIAGSEHDGGLDDGHPVIYTHNLTDKEQVRLNESVVVADEIGITGQIKHQHVAVDANNKFNKKKITIEPDRHGMSISFEGQQEIVIIDLSAGIFRVYCSNADGEVGDALVGIGEDLSD